MAVNHPFESLVSEFPDGTVYGVNEAEYRASVDFETRNAETLASEFDSIVHGIREATTQEEKKRLLFELSNIGPYADYRDELETRIGDIRLILDRLSALNGTDLFKGCMDTDRVGIFGHSLGGAAAVETASRYPERIAAAINYDAPPFIWDPSKDIALRTPVFFMTSTNTRIGTREISMEGINGAWFDAASAPVYELSISGAGHYNFSDLTYIPFLKMMGLIGPIDGERAGTIIKAYTLAFFDRYLKSRSVEILAQVPEEWKELDLKSRNTLQ
jgi:pimeloyl-ACP methyl ester carboxylesterase